MNYEMDVVEIALSSFGALRLIRVRHAHYRRSAIDARHTYHRE